MTRSPVLSIGRLRLRLPAGYEQRGEAIARLLALRLAEAPLGASAPMERLVLPALRAPAGATDGWIAAQLAGNIRLRLGSPQPGAVPPDPAPPPGGGPAGGLAKAGQPQPRSIAGSGLLHSRARARRDGNAG